LGTTSVVVVLVVVVLDFVWVRPVFNVPVVKEPSVLRPSLATFALTPAVTPMEVAVVIRQKQSAFPHWKSASENINYKIREWTIPT
jgi:hypothetical protein